MAKYALNAVKVPFWKAPDTKDDTRKKISEEPPAVVREEQSRKAERDAENIERRRPY